MGHERPMYDPIGIGPLQGSRRESTFVQREEGCGENLGYARLASRHQLWLRTRQIGMCERESVSVGLELKCACGPPHTLIPRRVPAIIQ